jgi:hypothetical protein
MGIVGSALAVYGPEVAYAAQVEIRIGLRGQLQHLAMVRAPMAAADLADLNAIVGAANPAIGARGHGHDGRTGRSKKSSSGKLVRHDRDDTIASRPRAPRPNRDPGYNGGLKPTPTQWPQIYISVGLTTLATLLLELSLTRVFSVVFYYHLAFMAISIALFGLGAGGVFSYVVGGWKGNFYLKLGRLSALNSVVVVVALTTVLWLTHKPGNWQLAANYFTTALPFFISGIILSLVISETVERVDRVYFFDLAGASAGCLLLIPFLERFGGLGTVIAVGVLFAAAAAVWHSMAGSVAGRVGSVALALGLVVFMFLNQTHSFIDIEYAKHVKLPAETFQ